MTSKKGLSVFWKVYKTACAFLQPVLYIVAAICGILCCFESAPGGHARRNVALLLMGIIVLLIAMKLVDRNKQKNAYYRNYCSKIVKKVGPKELIQLCFVGIIIILPFYVMFINSVKTPAEANHMTFTWWPKQGFTLEAYKTVLTVGDLIGLNLLEALGNSIIYTMVPLTLGLISATVAAYAYAKLQFKAKKNMYQIMIATMMMPGCVTMATSYMMFDWYGWTNSPLPLMIPGIFSGAGTVMYMREFIMGIPDGLLESARIDGAGKWQSFRYIIVPMARPAIVAQFILGFIGGFNDFMGPLIYINDPERYTLQTALNFMNTCVTDNAVIAASCTIATVPMLILYLIFQPYIVKGISMASGLKG